MHSVQRLLKREFGLQRFPFVRIQCGFIVGFQLFLPQLVGARGHIQAAVGLPLFE